MPFELSRKGWLEGGQVDDVRGEEGETVLCREDGDEPEQGHVEMRGLF